MRRLSGRLKKQEKLKVVLDTSVYVAAILSEKGGSAEVFKSVTEKKIVNFYTDEIFSEVTKVMLRAKLKIGRERQDLFLDLIERSGTKAEQLEEFKVKQSRDPDDDKFLSLAKQVKADFVVTLDMDLLVLRNIGTAAIIRPGDFIEMVEDGQIKII